MSGRKQKPEKPLGRYFRKFKLENVRAFLSPAIIDFCHEDGSLAQWTIILGENGTGKTTLLQYLAGMAPAKEAEKHYLSPERQMRFVVPRIVDENFHNWHQENSPASIRTRVLPSASLEFSIPAPGLTQKTPAESPLEMSILISNGRILPYGSWHAEDESFCNSFRVFGYGASRHVAGPSSPYLSSETYSQSSRTDPIFTLFNDDAPLISPEQWLLGLDHASRGDSTAARGARRSFKSAVRCLVNVLPGIHGISIQPHTTREGQPAMVLMCRSDYGEVPFGALSIGYRTMAAWLTDFVKRMHEAYPELDEPDDGPAVVLIDEFDLHMHPHWQRQAMQALSREFPNTQFIVTAHSPLVVQATEGRAKIVVLRQAKRADGIFEVLVDSDPKYAAGWRIDQILASDLYNLSPRSEKYSRLMDERIRLRQKSTLKKTEQKRLREVELELDREAPPEISGGTQQLLAQLHEALNGSRASGKK